MMYLGEELIDKIKQEIKNSYKIAEHYTNNVSVTTSTTETTILEITLPVGGVYFLTGSILLNNYGTQPGREHFLRVYVNNVIQFFSKRVLNSDVWVASEALAVPFIIGDNQKVKITVQSAIDKQWACESSKVTLLKIA